jgi:glycosyltransferase involved in cell wall biosynthesis
VEVVLGELVSIVIPCFNAQKWIGDCLRSCAQQTHTGIEIILVDDGSTDRSVDVARRSNLPNLAIYSQPNRGACAARNLGFLKSTGKWIQYLDADDIISPDKIEAQLECLSRANNCVSVCQTSIFHASTDDARDVYAQVLFETNDPSEYLIRLWGGVEDVPAGIVSANAWLTPRKLIELAGVWNEGLLADQDGEFFARVLLKASGVRVCQEGCNYYRCHAVGESLGRIKSYASSKSRLEALELKRQVLFSTRSDLPAHRAIGYQALSLAVDLFPAFVDLSESAFQLAVEHGADLKWLARARPRFYRLACFLGWKNARLIQALIQRLDLFVDAKIRR